MGVILTVAANAFAFPAGKYANKGGDVTITKAEGKNYKIEAISSDENGHSCEINGTLPETAHNVLSGIIDEHPVTAKISKGKLVLKAKDGEICGIGVEISGVYKKK